MAEVCDEWASRSKPNLWGVIPEMAEMQSEAGAAGAVHGALQAGALVDDVHGVAGPAADDPEHVQDRRRADAVRHARRGAHARHACPVDLRRSLGRHGLPADRLRAALLELGAGGPRHGRGGAGGDAPRRGFPFLHFFDGFRTSHEVAKIEELSDDDLRAMIDETSVVRAPPAGADAGPPVLRGTAQNPDVFFQAREACNRFYDACPASSQRAMDAFAELTGRRYRLFDYFGDPEAERVIVLMGSGAETAHETVDHLIARGEKVGVLKVRLYRPFSRERIPRRAADDRPKRSPCSIARRSPARPATRSTSTCRPRSPKRMAEGVLAVHSAAAHRRRPLRAVVEGVHAGDGEGGLRRARQGQARSTTSRSASSTM